MPCLPNKRTAQPAATEQNSQAAQPNTRDAAAHLHQQRHEVKVLEHKLHLVAAGR